MFWKLSQGDSRARASKIIYSTRWSLARWITVWIESTWTALYKKTSVCFRIVSLDPLLQIRQYDMLKFTTHAHLFKFHVYWFLVFQFNRSWLLLSKTLKYIFICILDYFHIQHASSCFNIMFLYLDEFWTKRFFIFEKSKFWKIRFLVFGKISITQKEFKIFVIWFDFYLKQICISKRI